MTEPHHFIFFAVTSYATCLSGRSRSLALALVAAGQRVTFVELPSVRTAVTGRLRFGVFDEGPIRVVRLGPLPRLIRKKLPTLEPLWLGYAARRLRRWIPDLDRAIFVITTPWWAALIERLPRRLSCYDCIDHVSVHSFAWSERLFASWDERLLNASDCIATVSEPLRNELAARFPADRIFLVPNGVRGDWVDSPLPPRDRASLTPKPTKTIVGFVGALFEWIDFDLITAVARRLPDMQFVFVGPQRRQVSIEPILRLPNARYLGPVPFDEVPALINAFDVCIIPFKRDIVSRCADPLKVYEYCALGKPVVSSVAFLPGVAAPIEVAVNADEFAAALQAARDHDSPQRRTDRIAFARRHTWDACAQAFIAAIDQTAAATGAASR